MFSVINDCYNITKARAESKLLAFDMEIDPKLPCVLWGDEVRIRQIINNFLSNSVKYTQKGRILLSIGFEQREEDQILLTIVVKDTGIGIRKEDMEKLFQTFTRIEESRNRNIEGTGLGLNLTKNLVELMGGEIYAESTYGEGSCFTAKIPQKVISHEPVGDFQLMYQRALQNTRSHKISFTAPQAKVLVVDDVEMNLKVFKGLLKKTGIQIDAAESGMSCLEYVKKKHYDLIFLDHMMPQMDGIETLQKMKLMDADCNRDTPVIMLTANATRGAREEYIAAGFSDYLTKPFHEEDLQELLVKYLGAYVHSIDEAAPDTANPLPELGIPAQSQNEADVFATPKEQDVMKCLGDIPELDVQTGLVYCMDEEFYEEMLKEYMHGDKEALLNQFFEAKDWNSYATTVHALKSTSLTIGAAALSDEAKALEMAAKDGDESYIASHHNAVMEHYRNLLNQLQQILQ